MLPRQPAGRQGTGDYLFLTGHSLAETGYLSDAMNLCQAAAGTLSVMPSRFFVSRTMITPSALAVSMQSPPLSLE